MTGVPERRRPKARIAAIVTVCALLVAGGITAGVLLHSPPTPHSSASSQATAAIERGAIEETATSIGTLEYADQREITAVAGGTVTSLPAVGQTLHAGDVILRVDEQPVILLAGSTPAWRAFAPGMSAGDDVKELESNLAQLGYFTGTVDRTYTDATSRAISKLQEATGATVTGSLPFGGIVIESDALRVASLTTSVGSLIGQGEPVLVASSSSRVVAVDLPIKYRSMTATGTAVTVELPTGTQIAGTVSAASSPVEKTVGTGSIVVIPTTIALTEQTEAGDLALATVSVRFVVNRRDDVLSVPISALLAIDDRSFAVDVAHGDTTKRVPVEVGLFANGRVEISGSGLAAAMKVVVPR